MSKSLRPGVAVLLLAACSASQRADTETAVAKVLVSDDQENKLGLQVKAELDKKGIRYVTDPVIVSYVQGVANRILPFATKDRPQVAWNVYVIDDPKTVNAFATPGGHLYVYTGLLLAAANEAELAGVWGHEAAHVVARHSARQLVTAMGLETVAALALGEKPGELAQLAAGILGNGYMLKNSRDDEREADLIGTRYGAAAGYDPHGIADFFAKLEGQQGRVPEVLVWLSTHPAGHERVERVNKYIAEHNLPPGDKGEGRLAPIQARIAGGSARPPTAPPPPPGARGALPGAGPPPSAPPPSAPPSSAPPGRPSAPPRRPR